MIVPSCTAVPVRFARSFFIFFTLSLHRMQLLYGAERSEGKALPNASADHLVLLVTEDDAPAACSTLKVQIPVKASRLLTGSGGSRNGGASRGNAVGWGSVSGGVVTAGGMGNVRVVGTDMRSNNRPPVAAMASSSSSASSSASSATSSSPAGAAGEGRGERRALDSMFGRGMLLGVLVTNPRAKQELQIKVRW